MMSSRSVGGLTSIYKYMKIIVLIKKIAKLTEKFFEYPNMSSVLSEYNSPLFKLVFNELFKLSTWEVIFEFFFLSLFSFTGEDLQNL